MANIRETLLDSLFFNKPPICGDLFINHERNVLPGRKEFILFLEESDSQVRTNHAKQILRRMAHDLAVFPPCRILLSLLEAEERFGPSTATSSYVVQDHFTHLVNLYLLGLYIFHYHKKLNRELIAYFRKSRKSCQKARYVTEERAYLDFIYCWRLFVLTHDIGYPWEMSIQGSEEDDSFSGALQLALTEVRKKFNSIDDMIKEELCATFIARMATWSASESNHAQVTLKEESPDIFIQGNTEQQTLGFEKSPFEAFAGFELAPQIHGDRYVRVVANTCENNDKIALLCEKDTDRVSSILMFTNGKWVSQRVQPGQSTESFSFEMAFIRGQTPVSGNAHRYELKIFTRQYSDQRNRFVSSLVTGNFHSKNDIKKLTQIVSTNLIHIAPVRTTTVRSDKNFRECEFWIYDYLLTWLGSLSSYEFTNIGEAAISAESVAISYENKVSILLSKILANKISILIKQRTKDNTNASLEVDSIVTETINYLCSHKDQVITEAVASISSVLKNDVLTETHRRELFAWLKTVATWPSADSADFRFTDEDGKLSKDIVKNISGQFAHLSKLFQNCRLPNLDELHKNYRPDHLGERGEDHGIIGATTLLDVALILRSVIKLMKTEDAELSDPEKATSNFLKFTLGLDFDSTESIEMYLYDQLLQEVAFAVAIHNIYPARLPKEQQGFRVHLHREPFAYLCILADSLQVWDRDRRLFQSTTDFSYKPTGDIWNIQIVDEIIRISERNINGNLKERQDKIKTGLDSFLAGASSFIEISLAEYK